MRRNSGATNITALLSVVSFMGLDLVSVRLGLARSLRLIRNLWGTVPPLSTPGLVLGAISLLAVAFTMWRVKLIGRESAQRPDVSINRLVGSRRR